MVAAGGLGGIESFFQLAHLFVSKKSAEAGIFFQPRAVFRFGRIINFCGNQWIYDGVPGLVDNFKINPGAGALANEGCGKG